MALNGTELVIRAEEPADRAAVRRINEVAFAGPLEADLVESLRGRGAVTLSLVATVGKTQVGHILFSPLRSPDGTELSGATALGPMAVLPEQQRQGVGSALVREGLARLRADGHRLVVVLGHPAYYPRFGFRPASGFAMVCEFEVPDDVFLALELAEGALDGWQGAVRYQPEFSAA